MSVIKRTRKQIESSIKKNADNIQKCGLTIGADLLEIREEHHWKGDDRQRRSKNSDDWDYQSFDEYLRALSMKLVGKSPSWSLGLVKAAEVKKIVDLTPDVRSEDLKASHLSELSRLAPTIGKGNRLGVSSDIKKLKPELIEEILEKAETIAKGNPVSVRDIRQAVDAKKGIDRSADAKAEREEFKRYKEERLELSYYLRSSMGTIQGITANLAKVPADGWKQLEKSSPKLAEQFAGVCDELAELLRS